MSGPVLRSVLDQRTLAVAIDPGKVEQRVWLATGDAGLIGEPVSLPLSQAGVERLDRLIADAGAVGPPVIGVEATGALHRPLARELERRFPGSLRLFAPSETQAARTQLGSRRFKSDDRCCARARDAARTTRPLVRCWGRFATAASSSTSAGRCANDCTTS